MKKIIFFIVFHLYVFSLAQSPYFLTFNKKDGNSKEWYRVFSEFDEYYEVKDKELIDNSGRYDILVKMYFDDEYNVGLVIDTKKLEFIEITIDGEQIDPFKDLDQVYSDRKFIVDINQTVKGHLQKKYESKITDIDELQKKVESISRGYLEMGGQLDLKIKFKDEETVFYRLIPEKYGFSWFNKALPINAQYSPDINNDAISNSVSLYYPIQYIKKDLNRKKALNWTSVTNKISFGPYILATIDKSVNFHGGGALIGIGLSPKGLPILGGGIAWIKDADNPIFVFTVNPIEIGRLIFNPSEILKQ